MADPAASSQQVSGVSNLAADLITLLHNKLDAIAALERYQQDAQGNQDVSQYFTELQQAEAQAVQRLKALVAQQLGQ
jgi:Mg2+ and Co2+ transporter CorA